MRDFRRRLRSLSELAFGDWFLLRAARWWVEPRGLLACRSEVVWTLKRAQRTDWRLEYFEDARESVYRCKSDSPKSGSRHSVGSPTAPLRPVHKGSHVGTATIAWIRERESGLSGEAREPKERTLLVELAAM